MSQLIIDLNDSRSTLVAVAKFLNDLTGDPLPEIDGNVKVRLGDEDDRFPETDADVNATAVRVFGNQTPAPESTNDAPTNDAPTNDAPTNDAPTNDAERDKAGIPWDKRIHASSKSKNADGTWRKRRNLDDEVFRTVMVEISPAPVVPASTGGLTWPVVLQRMAAASAAGALNEQKRDELLQANGLAGMPFLANRPDLFDTFVRELEI